MNQGADQPIFIGVMTGTSIDGLDIAAIRVHTNTDERESIEFVAAAEYQIPSELRAKIKQLAGQDTLDWQTYGHVDAALGDLTGERINHFLGINGITQSAVKAIGSHGQTVHHSPDSNPAFTVQLGDASRICQITGLPVVSDFRRADIAAGGQGAPLVPAFHDTLFRQSDNQGCTAICNIGGIANITLLPADPKIPITGFDTGPGNALLDAWCQRHQNQPYDTDGRWGASGKSSPALLSALLSDPYVQRTPPKSTGVEHYNLNWLDNQLADLREQSSDSSLTAADVQATLAEFTARTIVNSVRASQPDCDKLVVCGGGRHNTALMAELTRLSNWSVVNCDTLSAGESAEQTNNHIDGDALEAAAFAWLASQHFAGRPGNVPSVTGANKPVLLGALTRPLIRTKAPPQR